jgi:large subunit ribosomal protein L4
VVTAVDLPEAKTKAFVERLGAWNAQGKVLLVLAGRDEAVERSCRNLRQVRVILADSLNVIDLLDADTIVFTQAALARAQEVYA